MPNMALGGDSRKASRAAQSSIEDMDSTIVASLVGFGSAIATAIVASVLTRRRLRHELQSSYRGDLARKQMAACEALWTTLESTSFSPGSDRVIVDATEAPQVNSEAALQLANEMTRIFYSSHGLFMSRQVREALFNFREFICDELVAEAPEVRIRSISKTKAEKFRRKATSLRMALRAEIGVEDLIAARTIADDDA